MLKGIKLVREYRNKLENEENRTYYDINSLNSMLILNTAAVVEGSLSSLLIKHVLNGKDYKLSSQDNNNFLRNVLDDVIEQVYRGQMQKKDLKHITGINYSNF